MDDTRHLIHEIKNQLYIINMGLEVLRNARQSDDEFAKVVATIRSDGLEPLKTSVAALMERASRQPVDAPPKKAARKGVAERR